MTNLEIKTKIKRADKKRIYGQNILNKKGKLSRNYEVALGDVSELSNKIYSKHWIHSGRHHNLVDKSDSIINLIKALGYNYKEGNDAPQGGLQGDYIKISKTALKTLLKVKEL